MQIGRRSKNGKRYFMRPDGLMLVNKKCKPRIVIGIIDEEKNTLRSGNPSSFSQLGKSS